MKTALAELPPLPDYAGRLWVSFSGGLDSTVLLDLLRRRQAPRLHAVHVHHGLQTAADQWLGRCRQLCRDWRIPLRVLKVRVPKGDQEGPEAAARRVRYQALRKLLRAGDVLATAHHLDDQAETLLLRLLRGTGVAGLAAMRQQSALGPASLWRPLLEIPRAQLLAHAQGHGLAWVEDPHNRDPRYARSFLRADILPRLRERWPQAALSLSRSARLAAEAAELLDQLAQQDLGALAAAADALDVGRLLALTPARRNNALRAWLARRGLKAPPAEILIRLEAEVLKAKADAQPLLRCGDYEFRRYRQQLFVMPVLSPPPAAFRRRWTGEALALPAGCGHLRNAGPLRRVVSVRFAKGGEKIRLAAGAPTRSLKNLFQEHGVPPWLRPRMPLVFLGSKLLAVGDRWLAEECRALGLRPRWRHSLAGFEPISIP